MDAATAAAMSDPERNPHFRRRWGQSAPRIMPNPVPPDSRLGALGLALLEAWRLRQQRAAGATVKIRPRQSSSVAGVCNPREVV